jgi:tetratricopeptide (TPR) repeat protein
VFVRLSNIYLQAIFKQGFFLLLLLLPFVGMAQRMNLDSLHQARQKELYQTTLLRQKALDSTRKARAHFTDSIKIERKKRADSLARVKKYRESRRFRDSVAFVRQARIDSISAARKKIVDAATTIRKKSLDSMKHIRMSVAKALKDARTKISDSMKVVRKTRTDSLAKIKERREKLVLGKEKQREDKKVMAFQLKIKKKREAWSNDVMLKKHWGWKRRGFQNTYTHYNYFFNANRKMDAALVNMQKKKENYDELITLYPFNPNKDSASMASDMDSIIAKAALGIQIHDPRTKWGDNLYLLLGQANYYKGNYEQAATSFKYIISEEQLKKAQALKEAAKKRRKNIKKDMSILTKETKGIKGKVEHQPSNNDAALWLIRTYTDWQKGDDAESMIDLLSNDKNLDDKLKGRLALEKAYLQLSYGNIKLASDELTIVAAENSLPSWIRLRAAYLNGQLLYNQGRYSEASDHFQQVIDYKPKLEMDFYARKNLSYSLMNLGGEQEGATTSLKHMLNDGKYNPYYEQVYFILGGLCVNNNQLDDAISYYHKSVESPKTTRKQKAISFAGMGNALYLQHQYALAKAAYDSSVALAKAASGDSLVDMAIKRASVLNKITIPFKIIHDNDSLLRLSSKSLKEQKSVVRSYMKYLEDLREDSIRKAELAATTTGILQARYY